MYLKTNLLLISILFIQVHPNLVFGQWHSKTGIGSSLSLGNTKKFDASGSFLISHIDSSFEYSTFLKGLYGEIRKDTIKEINHQEYLAGIKFDYLPESKFSPFLLLQIEQNKIRKLDMRLTSLLGMKYTFINKTKKIDEKKTITLARYSISGALLYDAEYYYGKKTPKEGIRISIRPTITQYITDNIVLENVTFYKFNIKKFNDYTIDVMTSLSNKITKNISLIFSHHWLYESIPFGWINPDEKSTEIPADNIVEKLDMVFQVSLQIEI